MSLGGALTADQVALGQPTFTAARDAGMLMVAAAGNDATRIKMYPASFAGVVSVSAVDSTNTIAEFSNTGVAVDLAAPGVDLISTIPGADYALGTGTSMSSPHVAGVAALVRAARPGLNVDEVEAVLRASAVDLGAPGHDIVYGDGLVDAAAALVAPVPDPIPNLDPPTPLPSLSLSFLAPPSSVVQTATTYTVQIAVDHDVVESIALLGSWPQTNGHCKNDGKVHVKELTFGTTIELKHLQPGKCYQVYVAAVDDDFNYNEALSPIIKILDVSPRWSPSDPGAGHAWRRPVGQREGPVLGAGRAQGHAGGPAQRAHGQGRAGDDLVGRAHARARRQPGQPARRRTPATGSRSASRSSTGAATTSCRSTGASSPGPDLALPGESNGPGA